jgi:serine/threonine-protein kinase
VSAPADPLPPDAAGGEGLDPEALEGLAIVEAALHADAPDDGRDLLARGVLPREFDGLRLVELLGRGGMGEVYLARQLGLEREVAVKVTVAPASGSLPADDLFAREGRLLAALDHPGIVRVHGVGTVAGRRYLVMERVRGRTLEQAGAGATGTAGLLHLMADLASALAAAHARGVVHRDLKPANVVLAGEGGRLRPRLLDFGVAGHAFDPPEVPGLGTRRYMAPEQRDGRPVGPAADVFALGVMLRELLDGRRDVPPGISALLREMTAPDPAARPADGGAVLERLAPLLPPLDAAEAWRRRAPWLAAGLAVLVALVALNWPDDPARPMPPGPRGAPHLDPRLPPRNEPRPAFPPGARLGPDGRPLPLRAPLPRDRLPSDVVPPAEPPASPEPGPGTTEPPPH